MTPQVGSQGWLTDGRAERMGEIEPGVTGVTMTGVAMTEADATKADVTVTLLDGWTEAEQTIARVAFDRAYTRAIEKLILTVKNRSEALSSSEMVWALHDFLSIERHTIEGRFDFSLSEILFLFASLVKDNLLQLDELEGLTADKLSKVAAMARF